MRVPTIAKTSFKYDDWHLGCSRADANTHTKNTLALEMHAAHRSSFRRQGELHFTVFLAGGYGQRGREPKVGAECVNAQASTNVRDLHVGGRAIEAVKEEDLDHRQPEQLRARRATQQRAVADGHSGCTEQTFSQDVDTENAGVDDALCSCDSTPFHQDKRVSASTSPYLFAHEPVDHGKRCAVSDWAPQHRNARQQKVEPDG